jgi:predicted PurR-regulated permease PerM
VTLRRQAVFWIAALVFLLVFLWLFSAILLPFIMAMALAYLLDPVADRLQRAGMSRLWATVTIVLTAVLVLVAAVLILVPLLATQLSGFLERLPEYVSRLQVLGNRFFETRIGRYFNTGASGFNANQVVSQGASWMTTVLGSLWAGGQAVIGVISLFVVTPVVAFYLLYDWDRMVGLIDDLIPRQHLATVRRLGREIDEALSGFIRGQGAVCFILGLFYALALTAVGLNFGFLIGSVAGLLSFIPFVGSIIGFVLSVGVALVQFWPDWPWIVAVGAIFAVGQFFEGNILQPRLVGSSVGVHPVWLMFALLAFGSLFGFVGLLLAVPLTAALGVLVRFAVRQYRDSGLYRGREGEPPQDLLL